MEQKNRMKEDELRDEQAYAKYVLEQDRIRAQFEEAQRLKRSEEARMRKLENLELAKQANERKKQEMEAENEALRAQSHFLKTCPLLTEDTILAKNAHDNHRYRPDHFKGYEQDTRKQLWMENDRVLQEKQAILEGERQLEKEWAGYQASVRDKMQQAEQEKQRVIAEQNRKQREILAQQKAELEERRKQQEAERLPAIESESGFFSKFGQSCR